jgi:aminopeptidase N
VETVRALRAALGKKGEAWMVRSEAAHALGRIRGDGAFEALKENAATSHPKVRRAVASALGEFRNDASAQVLEERLATDASYLVVAEAARALGETRSPRALVPLTKALKKTSWADVVRAGALDGLGALRQEDAVPQVIEHTRYGHPTPARRSAVAALARLSDGRKAREHLEALLDDKDPHFRISVIRALEILGDVRARGALRRNLDRETDGRVARRLREALRGMGQTPATEQRRTADELEQVQRELTELKTRLAKLEADKKKPVGKRPKARGKPS